MHFLSNPSSQKFIVMVMLTFIVSYGQAQIVGSSDVCVGQSVVYQAGSTASTYSWSVSAGGTISGSSSMNFVTVNWTSSGNRTVYLVTTTSSGGGGGGGRPPKGGEQAYVDESSFPFNDLALSTTYTKSVKVNGSASAGSISGGGTVSCSSDPGTISNSSPGSSLDRKSVV